MFIDALPELPNKLQRKHWRRIQAHATLWHWHVRAAVGRKAPEKPLERAQIRLTRHSTREPDPDNLMASWKPVIDGLRHVGVIADDTREHVDLADRWEKAPRHAQGVTVEVEGL